MNVSPTALSSSARTPVTLIQKSYAKKWLRTQAFQQEIRESLATHFAQSANGPNITSTMQEYFSQLSSTNTSEGLTNLNPIPASTITSNPMKTNENSI